MSPLEAGAPVQRDVRLAITGMTCASCVRRVERALARVDGVATASVSLATESADVTGGGDTELDEDALVHAVSAAGYEAAPLVDGRGAAAEAAERRERRRDEVRRRVVRLGVGAVLSAAVLVLAYTNGDARSSQLAQLGLSLPVVVWVGRPFHAAALRAARHGTATMDTLVSLGALVAFASSAAFTLFPGLGMGTSGSRTMTSYDVATLVITLITVGKVLETLSRARAGEAIEALAGLQPRVAHLVARAAAAEAGVRAREPVDVPVEALRVGDIVLVRPGEQLPADGVVLEGEGSVDESMVTGESMPAHRRPDDDVVGATINGLVPLTVRVTRVGADTVLARILQLVERAMAEKAPAQRLADRVSGVFVPTIIAISLATFAGWLLTGHAFVDAMIPAVAVLVVACPCALGLATPVAVMVGAGRGAELGLLVRGGEALERVRGLRAIVFDKTGTLTAGRPAVVDVAAIGGRDATAALVLAAAVEQASEHPLARAIVERAGQTAAPGAVTCVEASPGGGVSGRVGASTVLVGSQRWIGEMGVDASAADGAAARAAARGWTPVVVAVDGTVGAVLGVADPVRPGAAAAVRRLRAQGLHVALASGDVAATAAAIAREVGIDDVHAGLRPEEKADVVVELRRRLGTVAMVGDGINDAPALAVADVGIAIGTGTGVAMATADITLVHGDIEAVASAIALSRATLRTIRQNLAWAFGYNAVLIPLAAAGILPPVLAALAMALSSVSVVLNALRLRRFGRERPSRAGRVGDRGAIGQAA
ncbi:MAG TPA: heavy metal translocating P-type ATPase [Candidatus Dormibacteraeota bacterium]|nr:heavy metal translocating P-type ATPase [Candidatus Dormibacteraeota bacterium]